MVKSIAQFYLLLDDAVGGVTDWVSTSPVSKFTGYFKLESTMYCSVKTSTTYSGERQKAPDHS